MSHANARLTPAGRLLMFQRIEAGMPQAHVASLMGLSRARWRSGGAAGARGASPRWWTGRRGLTARLGAPQRESRSASVVCVAALGEGLCICRRERGCRRRRCGGSFSATA